jgi:transcriptional regulator GlxA family with amidase domain
MLRFLIGVLIGSQVALGACRQVAADVPAPRLVRVAILVHDGVELMDFAGPAEVFTAAWGQHREGDRVRFEVFTVSPTNEPVASSGIMHVKATYSFENCPAPDVLVVSGGMTMPLLSNETVIEWIRKVGGEAEIAASVCTGAMLLAEAGLLDDKRATTHHNAIKLMRDRYPKVDVVEGQRFVDSGNVVTSAGVSSGIDMALALVERIGGAELAARTATYLEYEREAGK